MSENSAEMPRYKCHKEVWALRILDVTRDDDGPALVVGGGGFAPIKVTDDWCAKHKPVAGGYYVVYKDGFKSFSPAEAFEDGYTRIP